jgi:hypothetical protein
MRASGLVHKYLLTFCPLQSGQLQVGVLVISADATIADVHAAILTVISDARKVLFL